MTSPPTELSPPPSKAPGGLRIFGIVTYLLIFLAGAVAAIIALALESLPLNAQFMRICLTSCCVAGVGGCVYCLRAVYLNKAVFKRWDDDYLVWYLLRPVVSTACGGISYLFLRAGLLVLESNPTADASELGFYALAFIAGLNVDKFVQKIETIAHGVWGIERSRAASEDSGKPRG